MATPSVDDANTAQALVTRASQKSLHDRASFLRCRPVKVEMRLDREIAILQPVEESPPARARGTGDTESCGKGIQLSLPRDPDRVGFALDLPAADPTIAVENGASVEGSRRSNQDIWAAKR